MQQRDIRLLILIVVVAAVAIWVSLPSNPGIHLQLGDKSITRDIRVHQGLDLQGGMQVLLEADVPEDQAVDAESMAAARKIVESRVNGLGVTEPVVQGIGNRRILVELPGIEDPEQAIANLRETGLMEWVDTGAQFLPPGTVVTTDMATSAEAGETVTDTETVYHTVLTGKNLRNAQVEFDPTGFPVIAFELDNEGAASLPSTPRPNRAAS
jgi:preprotein translocase subunit SecD